MTDAKAGFAAFDASQAENRESVQMSGSSTSQGPICWVRDSAGCAVGVFPCEADPVVFDTFKVKGFTVETRSFPHSRSEKAVVVTAASRALEPQFLMVIQDVLDHAENSASPSRQIRETLDRWKEMFGGWSDAPLQPAAQIGLLAELHLLETAVGRMGNEAVRAWQFGPEGKSRHDFKTTHASVEVKATQGAEQLNVAIHGLRQLDPDEERPLLLFVQRFEPDPDGDSLDLAVERLRMRGAVDVGELNARLAAVGYRDDHVADYAVNRFAVTASKLLHVNDGFPRLAPSALRDPDHAEFMSRVSYALNVGPLPGETGERAAELATSFLAAGLQ